MTRKVEVCFSPFHIPLYELKKKTVVVIDVYRATSVITTALANGVNELIPVATIEEARKWKEKGFIVAAERKGAAVPGFDLDNSPLNYLDGAYDGKSIVITTSNGTKALLKATQAHNVLIGCFPNLQAVVDHLNKFDRPVMFLCAGWRDRFNLEDTVVAGAMSQALLDLGWQTECDSTLAAIHLHNSTNGNMKTFMQNASHTIRLGHLNLQDDLHFCNQVNTYSVVPEFKDGRITEAE